MIDVGAFTGLVMYDRTLASPNPTGQFFISVTHFQYCHNADVLCWNSPPTKNMYRIEHRGVLLLFFSWHQIEIVVVDKMSANKKRGKGWRNMKEVKHVDVYFFTNMSTFLNINIHFTTQTNLLKIWEASEENVFFQDKLHNCSSKRKTAFE